MKRKNWVTVRQNIKHMKINCNVDEPMMKTKIITKFSVISFTITTMFRMLDACDLFSIGVSKASWIYHKSRSFNSLHDFNLIEFGIMYSTMWAFTPPKILLPTEFDSIFLFIALYQHLKTPSKILTKRKIIFIKIGTTTFKTTIRTCFSGKAFMSIRDLHRKLCQHVLLEWSHQFRLRDFRNCWLWIIYKLSQYLIDAILFFHKRESF